MTLLGNMVCVLDCVTCSMGVVLCFFLVLCYGIEYRIFDDRVVFTWVLVLFTEFFR